MLVGTGLRFIVAAFVLPLVSAAARASDLDDYAMSFTNCASLDGGRLTLKVCGGGCTDMARAALVAPMRGVFVVDMHYEATSSNGADLTISTASNFGSFSTVVACSPCSGDQTDISIAVQASDVVTFQLYRSEFGCINGDPITCSFSNLRFVPAVGVTVLGGALDAATLLTHDPGSVQANEGIGALALLDDVDGDGRADIAASQPIAGPPSISGRVRVLSGATGAVLHEWLGANAGSQLGASLGNAGDVDGDGFDDIVASQLNPSCVRVFSAATGAELFSIIPTGGHPSAVDGAGDVDADGRGDIVIGATQANQPGVALCGKVMVYSGATQALLHEAFGDFAQDQLGGRVAGAGDVDADGFDDYLATSLTHPGTAGNGLVRVYSGLTGLALHSFVGQSVNERLGARARPAGDFDGDEHADIVAAGGSPQLGYDILRVYSGATGAVLFSSGGVSPTELIGRDVDGAGDLNGDGFDDVLASSSVVFTSHGYLRAFGGPSGVTLFEKHPLDYHSYGVPLAGGRDLNADGTPDIALMARTLLDQQRLFLLSGVPTAHRAPVLGATGSLLPNSGLSIDLTRGPHGGTAMFVVGLGAPYLPFKGGFLMPSPQIFLAGLPLQADGSLHLATRWPAPVVAPLTVVLQAWMPKPSALQGFVASNGLQLAPP